MKLELNEDELLALIDRIGERLDSEVLNIFRSNVRLEVSISKIPTEPTQPEEPK